MTNFKDLGELGEKMKAAMVRQKDTTGETKPTMSGDHLREALLGDEMDRGHSIDPRIISDFFSSLEDLCNAIIEDPLFGFYTSNDGDTVPRDTTDAHILIGRMIWTFEKQRDYHLNNLMENTKRMVQAAERAGCGEIDTNKLANLERFGNNAEAALSFWDDMINDLKAAHQNVTGKPYRHGKKNAAVDKEAAKALVDGINEIAARRLAKFGKRAS